MNNNTFSRWKESLHLKILSGYLILGLLVLGIITAVWYEKQVFEQAEAEERSLLMQRAAASEAYRGLITLFLDNDRAMLWEDSDMDTYDRRESHSKHSKKCTFYTLRFGCSFAAVNTIKPQLL